MNSQLPKDHESLLADIRQQVARAKGSEMTKTTRVMEVLNHVASATWTTGPEGLTLEADRAGKARQSIARIELRSLPDPQTKVHRPVKRVAWRPKFYFGQEHEDYSYAWKTWQDFVSTQHTNSQLIPLCEMLALYSIAIPHIKEHPIFGSYQDYIQSPEKFIEDMQAFNAMTDEQLEAAAAAVGLTVKQGTSIGAQLLIKGLALDGAEPSFSLNNIINNVIHGKTTMSNITDRLASVRGRATGAIGEGAATGGVGAINRAAVEETLAQMGETCPPVLKTEAAKTLLEGVLPLLVMLGSELPMVNGRVNKTALARMNQFAERALNSASHNATRQGGAELYAFFRPMMAAYMNAAMAQEAMDALTGEETFEEDDLTKPAQRTPELVLDGASGSSRGL